MKIVEILNLIRRTADQNNISSPFICGGVPRDKILGTLSSNFEDLDITTGDSGIHDLSKHLARILSPFGATYKYMNDGHSQIFLNSIKLDFSTNYISPNAVNILNNIGVKNYTNMHLELYSRDFTCNALLLTLDLKTIKDPTGLGIKDIERRILRTCLPAQYTLSDDNKRIVRILYLSAKLGFDVDGDIIDWVRNNPSSIANVKPKYLVKKLNQAININKEKTIHLLNEMNLWKYIPLTNDLIPHISHNLI